MHGIPACSSFGQLQLVYAVPYMTFAAGLDLKLGVYRRVYLEL